MFKLSVSVWLIGWLVGYSSAQLGVLSNSGRFDRNWDQVMTLLETPAEKQISIFVLLINPALAKKHESYVHYVTRSFDYSVHIFATAMEKLNLTSTQEQFNFVHLKMSKSVLRYIQARLSALENDSLKQWIGEHPAFLLKMTNRDQVKLMQNVDNLNYQLLLQWLEKQSRIPLIKFVKQMTSFSDVTVSLLNFALILTSLGFLVAGTRTNNFRLRQMATIPICLFPAGHVYNQIHGNDDGQTTWFGISFSRHYNGQAFSESYFIFFVFVLFAYGMFNFSENLKLSQFTSFKSTMTPYGHRRGHVRARAKMGDAIGSSSTNSVKLYFCMTLVAFTLLYHSYLLKY